MSGPEFPPRDAKSGLASGEGIAIVPPHLPSTDDRLTETPGGRPLLTWKVRLALVAIAAVLLALFATAIYVNPYDAEGRPYLMETHRQLGLPECTFKSLTGKPCPSCGMTTSFALLMRGDVINSFRANGVGMALAGFLLVVLPWALISLIRGRLFFVRSLEYALIWIVSIFLGLLLLRWAIVLL